MGKEKENFKTVLLERARINLYCMVLSLFFLNEFSDSGVFGFHSYSYFSLRFSEVSHKLLKKQTGSAMETIAWIAN